MTRLYEAARKIKQIEGQSAVASLLGETAQTVNNWESRGMSKRGILKAAEVLGIRSDWLERGGESMYGALGQYVVDSAKSDVADMLSRPGISDKLPDALPKIEEIRGVPASDADLSQNVNIPQFDTGGAMGHGVVLRDQPGIIESWRVSPDWVQKNVKSFTSLKNLAIVTGFGDSMRPMYNPGDPLLIDTGVKTVDFDGVYFFRVGDEGFVKRLQRIPGQGLIAISENSIYEKWTISKGMDFEVFGRVVKVWRGEEF